MYTPRVLEGPKIENKLFGKYEVDESGYVDFGDIARGELGMQCQYASRYVSGLDRPKLAEGLRVLGDPNVNYHGLKIHRDDVEEFIPKINKEIEDIRFESSSLKILSEASRKNVKDYVITNWKWLSVVVVVLIVVLILFYNQMMIFGLRRKLRNLKIEKETIVDLEKKNQKDYFEKKTISQATYKNYANKYKERILQVDEEIPVVEDQLRERQKFRIGYLTKRK